MIRTHIYYVYILTNKRKTTLYVGVTNNISRRLDEHRKGINNGFSKRYKTHYLVYYETFSNIIEAIDREKKIKKWRREKKDALIATMNPGWRSLEPRGGSGKWSGEVG